MLNSIRGIFDTFSKINKILNSKQKRRAIWVLLAILIGSIFELLGITIIVPFVSAVMSPSILLENRYVMSILEWFGWDTISTQQILLLTGGGLIVIYILKNIILVVVRYIQNAYQYNLQKEISVTMLKSYMAHPYEYFVNTSNAEIVRGIDADVSGFAICIGVLSTCLAEFITIAAIMGYLFITDPIITSCLIIVSIVAVLIIFFGIKRSISEAGESARIEGIRKYNVALQIVGGIKEIFVMQRKEYFVKKYEKANNAYSSALKRNSFVSSIPERVVEVMIISGVILVICYRIISGDDANKYIPQLSSFIVACYRLLPSINKITNNMSQLIFNKPALNAVAQNIETARKLEKKWDMNSNREKKETRLPLLQYNDKIEIDNIFWHYKNSMKNILNGSCLCIKKGEAIGIIGESGAGKSTLADILLGLYCPQKGKIKIDGMDISGRGSEWASMIGYVPQMVFLIDDTIRNNIAFGISEEDIDDDKVWEVLKLANLDIFVRNLPDGLNTIVGERGIKFSGGQRQRIAIARSLYGNPEIILLDEATSALDNETEATVMEAIDNLQGSKTLIIIAHRLSTLKKCNHIYEVSNGKIAEVHLNGI